MFFAEVWWVALLALSAAVWGAIAGAFLVLLIVAVALRSKPRASQKAPQPGSSANPSARTEPVFALVLLLRQPRTIDLAALTGIAERAFERPFDKSGRDRVAAVEPVGTFVIETEEFTLKVSTGTGAYFENPDVVTDGLHDYLAKRAVIEHGGWLAVTWVGSLPELGTTGAYRMVGKLVGHLAHADCLGIYCTSTRQITAAAPHLQPILLGEDPLHIFDAPVPEYIIEIDDDDPRIRAAVEVARQRLPEFIEAFKQRTPKQSFSVKAPFFDRDAQDSEYMWVEVMRIEGDLLQGILTNRPEYVKSVRHNDVVQVKLADVNDWLYTEGLNMVGGFTNQVMEEAERSATQGLPPGAGGTAFR